MLDPSLGLPKKVTGNAKNYYKEKITNPLVDFGLDFGEVVIPVSFARSRRPQYAPRVTASASNNNTNSSNSNGVSTAAASAGVGGGGANGAVVSRSSRRAAAAAAGGGSESKVVIRGWHVMPVRTAAAVAAAGAVAGPSQASSESKGSPSVAAAGSASSNSSSPSPQQQQPQPQTTPSAATLAHRAKTVIVFVHGAGRDRRAFMRHMRVFHSAGIYAS